ncbi:hypothetical protein F4782DRAFT_549497 [Xylaria castorea]|nr:hypothetical protein F4782DRAFT_549497 [Xylaria castorea]
MEMPQLLYDTPPQRKMLNPCLGKLLMRSSVTRRATQLAALRTDTNRISRLERLPNELKLMVIVQIADARSIFRLALTGPHFCAFISAHERRVAGDVIKKIIPAELLHLAIATYTAIKAYWNVHNGQDDLNSSKKLSGFYVNSIVDFVERYRCPKGFTLQTQHPRGPALYEAHCYFMMHDTISILASQLALRSMRSIPKVLGFAPEISPTVLIRYEKALYILQLVAELFAWRGGDQTNQMHLAWGMFWFALAPWEVEQVYCAQTLLTWHVLEEMETVCPINHFAYHDWLSTLGGFITYSGPVRLGGLDNGRLPDELALAFKAFGHWNPSGFIQYGHPAPAFGLRLVLDRIGQRLNQGTKDGSPAFGDIDLGPMKHWYCLFLFRGLEKTRPGHSHSFFSCMHCLILSGYAFWDEIEPSRLPTLSIDVMHRMVVQNFKEVSQRYDGPHNGARVAAMWFRRWENCTAQGFIPPPLITGLIPLPYRHAAEYCFRITGQVLAEEKESTR